MGRDGAIYLIIVLDLGDSRFPRECYASCVDPLRPEGPPVLTPSWLQTSKFHVDSTEFPIDDATQGLCTSERIQGIEFFYLR